MQENDMSLNTKVFLLERATYQRHKWESKTMIQRRSTEYKTGKKKKEAVDRNNEFNERKRNTLITDNK